jgi:poly-gamma-glutamate synthesis protein (capsule biosynthesis protein)
MNHFAKETKGAFLGFFLILVIVSFVVYKNSSQLENSLKIEASTINSEKEINIEIEDDKKVNEASSTVKILFVGDMMFDRRIREITEKTGGDYIFSCIDDLLKSVDLVVGNLEGPITKNKSVSKGSVVGSSDNYRFTFPITTAELLFRHNIRAVTLGNNHINNFGESGIESTRDFLDKAGVGYFGGLKDDETILEKNIKGVNFSFIAYNAFGGDDYRLVEEKIKSQSNLGNKVIVFAHWGEEYSTNKAPIKEIAKIFVESGASLIAGSHPHVVVTKENIDGVPVYYSLGNFIFDQYWKDEVKNGLAALVEFNDGSILETEYPVEIFKDGRVCLKNPL